jgi:Transcriptional regulator
VDTLSIQKLKEKEKEKRRNYILDTAEKLFFSKGYDNVSMKDISDEVGISRAALYLYFKNKEVIYLAIVLRGMRIINEMFKESVKSEKDGLGKLEDTGRAYFEFYRGFPDYYDICIYFDFKRFYKVDKEYIFEIDALKDERVDIMRKSIEEGIGDGSIRSDVNPLEAAFFIATTSKQVVKLDQGILNALEREGINYEQYIEDSIDMWGRMLANIENKGLE